MERVKQWAYDSGFPADAPKPESGVFTTVDAKRKQWLQGRLICWTVHEWLLTTIINRPSRDFNPISQKSGDENSLHRYTRP